MGDVLKSAVIVGSTGDFGSMAGIVTLRDNHGNSTRRYTLSCAGQKALHMTDDQLYALHKAIGHFAFSAINIDGTIPIPDGFESPLQTMCRKINSGVHHPK